MNVSIQICCLRITEEARARVEKAGGEVITFEQLATQAPTGKGTVLIQGQLLSIYSYHIVWTVEKLSFFVSCFCRNMREAFFDPFV